MAARRAARTHQARQTTARERLPPVRSMVLSRVSTWFDHAQSGRASAGVLVGPAGTGKSVLAGQSAAVASNLGFVTVSIEGHLGNVPSALCSELARELGLSEEEFASTAGLLRAIRFELQRLGTRGRCVALVLDDVQRYSAVDLAIVQDLVLHPPLPRFAAVLTLQPDEPSRMPPHVADFLQAVDAEPTIEWLSLGPLTREEATFLVESHVPPGAAAPRFIRDALELTSGNATNLTQLVQHVMTMPAHQQAAFLSGSRTLDDLDLPEAVTRRAAQRLAGLQPRPYALLEALAVWALPASIELIVELSEGSDRAVEAEMERLELSSFVVSVESQAVPQFRLADPIEARVVYQNMPVLRRRRLHQRAVGLFESRGVPVVEDELLVRANHYLGGSDRLASPHSGHILQAARYLVERTRYGSAHELLTRFIDRMKAEAALDDVPHAAFVLLAETSSRSGAWHEANQALATASSAREDEAASGFPALRRTARDLVARGREPAALEIYRKILQAEGLDPGTRAQVLEDAARIESMLGRPDEATRHYREALALAESVSDTRLSSELRLSQAIAFVMRGQAAQGQALSVEGSFLAGVAGDRNMLARALSSIGTAVGDTHSLARGNRWLRRALRAAERSDDYSAVSWIGWRLASAYIELGDWGAARSIADTCVHIDAGLHRIRSLRRSRAMQSLIHALEGRSDALDERLGDIFRGVELFGGPSVYIPDLVARYEHQLLSGDHEAAAATIESAHELLLRTPGWERYLIVDVLPRRASLAAASGSESSAREAASGLERLRSQKVEMLPLLEVQITHANAQLALVRREWTEAARLAEAAADGFDELGYRWRRALARRDAGSAWMRAGETVRATASTQEAYELFEGMGALRQLEGARETLLALGRAPKAFRRRSTLTARQWQIAELASQSLTDIEIAGALGISRRTVTTHMHNILQTLELQSRTELRAWITAHEGERALAFADLM